MEEKPHVLYELFQNSKAIIFEQEQKKINTISAFRTC